MNFDNAIELQATIIDQFFGGSIVDDVAARARPKGASRAGYELAGADRSRAWPKQRAVAVGVSRRSEKPKSYDLLLIVQDKKELDSGLVETVKQLAKNEVSVVFTGPVRARTVWHQSRIDPLRPGASIGHPAVTAGTLGCFVRHRETDRIGVLTNNHVAANVNRAAKGDALWQPGRADGGGSSDIIAKLAHWVPIDTTGKPNAHDCAWAELSTSRGTSYTALEDSLGLSVGAITLPTTAATLGMEVLKTGRTTGYTQGEITGINISNLFVGMGPGVRARFDGQIAIQSLNGNDFSQGGDSGSLVVDKSFSAVGLLFAGGTRGTTKLTFANPIDGVLSALDLDIVV